jgi:hypothetical protein
MKAGKSSGDDNLLQLRSWCDLRNQRDYPRAIAEYIKGCIGCRRIRRLTLG